MQNQRKGFTLLETVIVVFILGVLISFSLPAFNQILIKSKMQAQIGMWQSAFYLAQKEAIRLKHRIILCPSTDGISCNYKYRDFSKGWIIFDMHSNRVVKDYPPIEFSSVFAQKLGIANGVKIIFSANGRLPSNFAGANFQVAYETHPELTMKISISRSGAIRYSDY